MKIIDLLNKIANGEIPKKIIIDRWVYTHNGIDYTNESGEYLFNTYLETTPKDMNMEVEIIEEDKKIEKIELDDECIVDYYDGSKHYLNTNRKDRDIYIKKINEIIDYLNSKGE